MEEQRIDTQEEFSLLARARSFSHAGRGLRLFVLTTHNAWIHGLIFIGVVVAGWWFQIAREEWVWILLASGLVLLAECINTAIEIDINLTSPTYHPYARDTKDVAAGAVLIAVIFASLIGVIVFTPYVSQIF